MSLTTTPGAPSSDILQFNVNDSTLDLLNAAIASHTQESNEQNQATSDQHSSMYDGNSKKRIKS
jgi:hypothetical protein